jgi:D-glycero-alpha-D-manno-heptose-7-phosphate kinase
MVIRGRAPVRIDFAGGFTDVKPYCVENKGAVVNAAINRYSYVSLWIGGDELKLTSMDYNQSISSKSLREMEYDGNLDLFKAALKRLGLDIKGEIKARCDAPPASGLGTSASLGVCLIGVLNLIQDRRLSLYEIAELAHRLETEELGISGGRQDQYASALGGILYQEFDEAVHTSPLRISEAMLCNLEKHLILCYTGKSRLSGDIVGSVMERYKRGDKEVKNLLDEMKAIAQETKDALLKGDVIALGKLMSENWERQKRLYQGISNEYIEHLFRVAENSGSIGGKAMGAGGGGCLLFLSAPDTEHILRRKLQEEGAEIIDMSFSLTGLVVWRED